MVELLRARGDAWLRGGTRSSTMAGGRIFLYKKMRPAASGPAGRRPGAGRRGGGLGPAGDAPPPHTYPGSHL